MFPTEYNFMNATDDDIDYLEDQIYEFYGLDVEDDIQEDYYFEMEQPGPMVFYKN